MCLHWRAEQIHGYLMKAALLLERHQHRFSLPFLYLFWERLKYISVCSQLRMVHSVFFLARLTISKVVKYVWSSPWALPSPSWLKRSQQTVLHTADGEVCMCVCTARQRDRAVTCTIDKIHLRVKIGSFVCTGVIMSFFNIFGFWACNPKIMSPALRVCVCVCVCVCTLSDEHDTFRHADWDLYRLQHLHSD